MQLCLSRVLCLTQGLGRDASGRTVRLPATEVAVVERVDLWHKWRPSVGSTVGIVCCSAAFITVSVLTGGGAAPVFLSLPWFAATSSSCLTYAATSYGANRVAGRITAARREEQERKETLLLEQ